MQISHAIRFPVAASTRNIVGPIAGSLVIALAAQVAIPIPFSPVPLTLQPLAVLLVGVVLGSVRGAAAASLYLLEGLLGLPVFAQGRAGVAALLGPTAGYLYAFPAAAFMAGWAAERGWTRSYARAALAMLIAIAVIHLGGWSWLAAAMGLGPGRAFAIGVSPFLLNDLLKIAIATVVAVALKSRNHAIAPSRD